MRIENNIKTVMEAKGVSALSLSQEIGMSWSGLHALINKEDIAGVKLGNIIKIAQALQVDVTELYCIS